MTWLAIPLGQVVTEGFDCHDPATDEDVTADSTPTFAVFEETTDTAIVTGNFTERAGHTGKYRCQFTASSGNGFEVGKTYHCYRMLTVGGIANSFLIGRYLVRAAESITGVANTNLTHVIGEAQIRNSTVISDYGPSS